MSSLKYHHYDDARTLSHLVVYDKASRELAGLLDIFFQQHSKCVRLQLYLIILVFTNANS